MPVIELREVTRRFGDLTAVDAVTLDVEEGEIVGLLGHNGAGKTTLIRVINGLLRPDAGQVRVRGLDPSSDGATVRRLTGVLTEYPALDEYLSARENLQIYAAINEVPEVQANARIHELLEQLGLVARADHPTRSLSAGLKQRVALARAMVHDPSLLLLDEPTTNMDPVAARGVRELITSQVHQQGRTVLLSTHNLVEAEQLCDRIAIVREGRVLVQGPPGQLRRQLDAVRGVRLRSADGDAAGLVSRLPSMLRHRLVDTETVEVSGTVEVAELVATLVGRGVRLAAVEPLEATLEDLYLAVHADAEEDWSARVASDGSSDQVTGARR
jgi:ABC-2 type transport system ATP-binding protein